MKIFLLIGQNKEGGNKMQKSKILFLMTIAVVSILICQSFGTNRTDQYQDTFKFEMFSIKKYFDYKNDDVMLFGKIELLVDEDKTYEFYRFASRGNVIKYIIKEKNTNKVSSIKEPRPRVGIVSYGLNYHYQMRDASSNTRTSLKYYDIWEYDIGGGRAEYYKGDYTVTVKFPVMQDNSEGINEILYYLILEGIEYSVLDSAEFFKGKIVFEPQKWNFQWQESEPEGYINCFIGNLDSGTVEDIVQDEIWLSGTLKPETIKVKNHHAGFDGKVLHLQFKKKDVIKFVIFDRDLPYNVNVQAKLKNGKILNAETKVEILTK